MAHIIHTFKRMSQSCKGFGTCLIQRDEGGYILDPNCTFNCVPIRCPNYVVCGSMDPAWCIACHGGTCTDCDVSFGKWRGGSSTLGQVENMECPVCLETKLCVTQGFCSHPLCVACFRKCYYFTYDVPPPEFPYSKEIEDKYDEDPDSFDDDFLIWLFNRAYNEWDDNRESAASEHYRLLARCPICRA